MTDRHTFLHLGKMGQLNDRVSKKVVVTQKEVLALQSRDDITIKWYKVISPTMALITYGPILSHVPPYSYGNVMIPALVTAKGRIMINELAMKLDTHGYMTVYQVIQKFKVSKVHLSLSLHDVYNKTFLSPLGY
jgi:hypothetical protein